MTGRTLSLLTVEEERQRLLDFGRKVRKETTKRILEAMADAANKTLTRESSEWIAVGCSISIGRNAAPTDLDLPAMLEEGDDAQ